MRNFAVLALDQMVLLDVTIPLEAFQHATDLKGETCYNVVLCGPNKQIRCSNLPVKVEHPLVALRRADTIVIPGMKNSDFILPADVRRELQRAYARGARLVSVCSGALLLAQTGLLDGKRATTHWMAANALKERHPKINVDPNVLYVEEGRILTSAGGFAGMDLCLHILRTDFGAAVATRAARFAVTPLERAGGQAQFISYEPPQSESSLEPLLAWIQKNLQKDLSVDVVANRARMSVRTLNRQFQKQLGTSPQRWITLARVRRAREYLEATDHSVERISDLCGFPSALSMREHFRDQVCSSPTEYRRAFRKTP